MIQTNEAATDEEAIKQQMLICPKSAFVYAAFGESYGRKFKSEFEQPLDILCWLDRWQQELHKYSMIAIKLAFPTAIRLYRDWQPTLGQFLEIVEEEQKKIDYDKKDAEPKKIGVDKKSLCELSEWEKNLISYTISLARLPTEKRKLITFEIFKSFFNYENNITEKEIKEFWEAQITKELTRAQNEFELRGNYVPILDVEIGIPRFN